MPGRQFFFQEEITQLVVQLRYWPFHPTGTWPSFEVWKEKLHSSVGLPDSLPYSQYGFRIDLAIQWK